MSNPEEIEFLKAWTEAAGKPGYIKEHWKQKQAELEARIYPRLPIEIDNAIAELMLAVNDRAITLRHDNANVDVGNPSPRIEAEERVRRAHERLNREIGDRFKSLQNQIQSWHDKYQKAKVDAQPIVRGGMCKICGRSPGVYGGMCGSCRGDHDL